MARITEDSLDELERRKLRKPPAASGRPAVDVSGGLPVLALVLLVGGAIVGAAPDLLPQPANLFGLGALALGGWLARGPRSDGAAREQAVAIREASLNRVLTHLALRDHDVLAELARRSGLGPADGQPDSVDGDDRGQRRRLSAVPHVPGSHLAARAGGESLDPDADDGVLG